jgi:hypothetical protein
VDLFFSAMHVGLIHRRVLNELFSIENDQGYAEIYQYIKEFWIIAILVVYLLKFKKVSYLFWFLFFSYVLIDDSMRAHEQVSDWLDVQFDFPTFSIVKSQSIAEFFLLVIRGFHISDMVYYFTL